MKLMKNIQQLTENEKKIIDISQKIQRNELRTRKNKNRK